MCREIVRRPLYEGDVCYLTGNIGSKVKRRKVAVFNSARKIWDPNLHPPEAPRTHRLVNFCHVRALRAVKKCAQAIVSP